jgi:hypothetical protein
MCTGKISYAPAIYRWGHIINKAQGVIFVIIGFSRVREIIYIYYLNSAFAYVPISFLLFNYVADIVFSGIHRE